MTSRSGWPLTFFLTSQIVHGRVVVVVVGHLACIFRRTKWDFVVSARRLRVLLGGYPLTNPRIKKTRRILICSLVTVLVPTWYFSECMYVCFFVVVVARVQVCAGVCRCCVVLTRTISQRRTKHHQLKLPAPRGNCDDLRAGPPQQHSPQTLDAHTHAHTHRHIHTQHHMDDDAP